MKAFGEESGFLDPNGGTALTFVVEGVVAPLECTEPYYDYEPENGVIVGVQMRVTTGANLTGLEYFAFDGQDFAFIGPDGVTRRELYTLPAYACLPNSQQFTSEPLGPNQTYVGTIVLDVPAPAGTLVYAPSSVSNINGWEWTF
ncbi:MULTISPECIES: hypothetical protein [unclassified Blastococcus]